MFSNQIISKKDWLMTNINQRNFNSQWEFLKGKYHDSFPQLNLWNQLIKTEIKICLHGKMSGLF